MLKAVSRPRVALTMGDVAGIGPEVIVRAWADPALHAHCTPLVIGDAGVLRKALFWPALPPRFRSSGIPKKPSLCRDWFLAWLPRRPRTWGRLSIWHPAASTPAPGERPTNS